MRQLRALPYEELGFAKIDHHRLLRRGFPEVILCEGKTIEQIERIVHEQIKHGGLVMATKATREVFEAVQRVAPMAQFHELARIIVIRPTDDETQVAVDEQQRAELPIAVVLSAGTSDIPVAEEAAVTAETLGMRVHRIYDVGVAGLHRLLDHRRTIEASHVVIVVAGMDGALPSVVAGLVAQPVIAVPTSIGYGASFQGLAALLTMLNSCAPGVVVVNIDNGFGAGYFAALIGSLMTTAK